MTVKEICKLRILSLSCSFLYLFNSCTGIQTPPSGSNSIISDSTNLNQTAPTINVYLENSGSMFGYVKGVTEFEQSVYSYLSDINISDYCDSLNLNYINSKILNWPKDVRDFIEKLEPSTFKIRGGNLGVSDLSDIIGKIQDEQNNNDIAIFISDCVFSPGAGVDADQYLINQQIGIKGHVAQQLKKNPNYAIIVYRLLSKFDGVYYNRLDQRQIINDNRPFYIWIMGDCKQLKRLTSEVSKEKIKGKGVTHSYTLFNPTTPCSYRISRYPIIGTFTIDKKEPLSTIMKAKPDKKNGKSRFLLAIDIDFSTLLLDNEYLINPTNYSVSNGDYSIEIASKGKINSPYTHTILLKTDKPIISKGQIVISLYWCPLKV